jgi:hypothetical protein
LPVAKSYKPMNVRQKSFRTYLFFTLLTFGTCVVAAAINTRIKVDESTAKSLSAILKGSDSLHSNLVVDVAKRDHKKVREDAIQLIQAVRTALKTARGKEPAENLIHLEKILMSMEGRLQDFLSVPEQDSNRRLFFLREMYQLIIQIARQYDVNNSYNIFFCPKDKNKGIWIQKSTKAQNPFDVDGTLKNCGALVK